MTKTTTNLLLMLITIVAGTYFNLTSCSECGIAKIPEPSIEQAILKKPEVTSYLFNIDSHGFQFLTNDNDNFDTYLKDDNRMLLSTKLTKDVFDVKVFVEGNETNVNAASFYKIEQDVD